MIRIQAHVCMYVIFRFVLKGDKILRMAHFIFMKCDQNMEKILKFYHIRAFGTFFKFLFTLELLKDGQPSHVVIFMLCIILERQFLKIYPLHNRQRAF